MASLITLSVSRSPAISARTRVLAATVAGIAFVLAYIALAVSLPDLVSRQHWAVEALYWCVAGVLWVIPVWALMLFASGQGGDARARKARALDDDQA